jgi:hypothetical protein
LFFYFSIRQFTTVSLTGEKHAANELWDNTDQYILLFLCPVQAIVGRFFLSHFNILRTPSWFHLGPLSIGPVESNFITVKWTPKSRQ